MQSIQSQLIPLGIDNIDTDQIIPARFLKATSRSGFEDGLFYNWRYLPDGGANPDFILNQPEYQGQVLVAGNNFGCGSSREHAAWALADYGFKAIISSQFADIFKGNALKNGILPIEVDPVAVQQLLKRAAEVPGTQVEIDLPLQKVEVPELEWEASFDIHPFHKYCLEKGFDEIDYLRSMEAEILAFEQSKRTLIPWA